MRSERQSHCETTEELKGPYSIADLKFIDSMQEKTISYLNQNASTQHLKAGHIIFMHQDPADRFYFLKSGWVKLFRETLDGDESILDVLPQGSVFGESSFFEGGFYSCSAEALENCELISYSLTILTEEVSENGLFAVEFLKHTARKNLIKEKEIELRSVQKAPQRIGCFLLRLCRKEKGNSKILHLSWEKAQIAARLGMTPETFSRSLAKLQAEVQIRIKGPTIEILDINALVKYTCSACSDLFPCKN